MALSKITADSLGANAVTANAISNTAIIAALGHTPANKAGDTFTGNVVFSANATVTGAATFSNTVTFASNGAITIPVGTTSDRPTGAAGMIRMNTTTGEPEWYDTTVSTWIPFAEHKNYSVDVLIVAGGGAGSGDLGGGGGAGGAIDTSYTVAALTGYSLVIGAGAAATSGQNHYLIVELIRLHLAIPQLVVVMAEVKETKTARLGDPEVVLDIQVLLVAERVVKVMLGE